MKKIQLLMVLAITSLIFTACQNEQTTVYDDMNTEQLLNEKVNLDDIVRESQIHSATQSSDFVIQDDRVLIGDQEIRLDYHEKYGVVRADEFPMDPNGIREPNLDTFLARTGMREQDIANYSIERELFSGVGYAQHRMRDGEVIEVAHRFENEPVYRFEGELRDGKRFRIIIIIVCSNGLIIVIIF
ncbi:hypothetical protein [Ascidiimonas aurantiaca]|uniref:hypothetical protein n=1 Tax=Ascidiimonas aurantiaca TaxID=1685432 RepID=UPI0030ECCA13